MMSGQVGCTPAQPRGDASLGKDSTRPPLDSSSSFILIIALLGGFSGRFRGYGYGHGGIGVLGVILIIVVVLLLTGRLYSVVGS
jgi:hypothetical protein